MGKIKVGVLRGGPGAEYEISLLTGENVLKHLPREKYETHDVLLSKDGVWHFDGFPKSPERIFRKVDIIFNALHGEYGEDGKVQQILEAHSIPYTGSGILASALGMNKILAREVFQNSGLKVPRAVVLTKFDKLEEKVREARESLTPWWTIKPASRGSSVGVTIAKSEPEIWKGLKKAFGYDSKVIIEEHIEGREATCGVIENFRNEKYYALPVVEIVPPPGRFFDYEVKYDGTAKEICPARFDTETSDTIKEMAILAHKVLGSRHYSRSDFVVAKRGVFILELNTLPGLTSESLLPKAALAAGLSFPGLLDHLIWLKS